MAYNALSADFQQEPPPMAEQERPFDVFLSYNSKDRPAVLELARRLQAQGLRVWLDVWELRPGRPWQEALEEAIESIGAAAVLVGQDGIGPWQSREMRSFLNEFAELGKPVVPVLLDGCPETPKLPIFLKHFTWVDFRGGQADESFGRLVWGVTGEKPTALSHFIQPSPVAAATPSSVQNNAAPAPLASAAHETASLGPLSVPRETENPAPAAGPIPGHSFRDALKIGGFGPAMVVIPAGSFRMGDLDGKGYEDERPVHTVRIAKPFAIGVYAVTFEEYDAFVQAKQGRRPSDYDWGRERRPVVDVSWEDACAYARWLSEQTGKTYRLPSEAEWEYAARAGTETAYWWGDEIGQNRANCDGSGSPWSNQQTASVGSFDANPWGLHDTAGNVWEWVQDSWHGNYQGAPEDGSAWESGGASSRVLRGGSWDYGPGYARCAFRFNLDPAGRYNNLGFRLACSLPITEL